MMPVRPSRVYSFGNLNKDAFKGLPGILVDSLIEVVKEVLSEKDEFATN